MAGRTSSSCALVLGHPRRDRRRARGARSRRRRREARLALEVRRRCRSSPRRASARARCSGGAGRGRRAPRSRPRETRGERQREVARERRLALAAQRARHRRSCARGGARAPRGRAAPGGAAPRRTGPRRSIDDGARGASSAVALQRDLESVARDAAVGVRRPRAACRARAGGRSGVGASSWCRRSRARRRASVISPIRPSPHGWLATVATRRSISLALRSSRSRRHRPLLRREAREQRAVGEQVDQPRAAAAGRVEHAARAGREHRRVARRPPRARGARRYDSTSCSRSGCTWCSSAMRWRSGAITGEARMSRSSGCPVSTIWISFSVSVSRFESRRTCSSSAVGEVLRLVDHRAPC